jgi:splicing factor 3B subunit 2
MPESSNNASSRHQTQRELLLKIKKADRRKQRRHNKKENPDTKNDAVEEKPALEDEYEIEYIPDVVSEEYSDLLQKFVPMVPLHASEEAGVPGRDEYSEAMASILNADAQRRAAEAAAESIMEMTITENVSKKQLRLSSRMSVAALKAAVDRPDMVDSMDNCSPDPLLLLYCKAYKNAVQVPRHWSNKRRYMSAKRGVDKVVFKLPEYIEQTGIAKIRQAVLAKEAERDIKAKQRAKMRPKTGKLDIDYQVLHNAFFKYQTKPAHLTKMGDLYYEGREAETRYVHKKPGRISPTLREALGMIEGSPPPWLINMQRFGPPPAYPNLKVAGLNAPIPYGAEWGYHPGGWGRAPVDELGNPIYGGTWNPERDRAAIVDLEMIQPGRGLWGQFIEEDSEDEDEENVVKAPVAPIQPPQTKPNQVPQSVAPPQYSSGVAVTLAGIAGAQNVVPAPPRETTGELYRVLPQKAAPSEAGALFPSRTVYEVSADVTGGITTETGIAQRAIEVEGVDTLSTEMIAKQLAEHEAAAQKTLDAKKPAKKKAKFKF